VLDFAALPQSMLRCNKKSVETLDMSGERPKMAFVQCSN
jgi:hypothetical protein